MNFINIPTEQTTAITDAILAFISMGCMLYLHQVRQRDPWKTKVWLLAFGLLTLSALLGTIIHGIIIMDEVKTLLRHILNLALGLTIAMFVVGVVYDWRGYITARRILPIMIMIGLVFYIITRIIPGTFLVFIIYEAIAMVFALGTYGWLVVQRRFKGAGLMMSGILINMLAAGIQATHFVSISFIWEFDHNGIFHLVQIVGVLFLISGLCTSLISTETV